VSEAETGQALAQSLSFLAASPEYSEGVVEGCPPVESTAEMKMPGLPSYCASYFYVLVKLPDLTVGVSLLSDQGIGRSMVLVAHHRNARFRPALTDGDTATALL
jgi:hypothetical protein